MLTHIIYFSSFLVMNIFTSQICITETCQEPLYKHLLSRVADKFIIINYSSSSSTSSNLTHHENFEGENNCEQVLLFDNVKGKMYNLCKIKKYENYILVI